MNRISLRRRMGIALLLANALLGARASVHTAALATSVDDPTFTAAVVAPDQPAGVF